MATVGSLTRPPNAPAVHVDQVAGGTVAEQIPAFCGGPDQWANGAGCGIADPQLVEVSISRGDRPDGGARALVGVSTSAPTLKPVETID
jgi:hypothetical protein